MMPLLWRTVLALVIAYLAAKGWVYHQAQQWLASVKQQYALEVAIDSGWIGSSLWRGEIYVDDVVIHAFRLRQDLRVDQVVFAFDHRAALFALPTSADGEALLPSPLRVGFSGVSGPLQWWQELGSMLPEPLLAALEPPCGAQQAFSLNGLEVMDYGQLSGDLGLSLEKGSNTSGLVERVSVHADMDAMIDLRVTLERPLGADPSIHALPSSLDSIGEVQGFSLGLADRGLFERLSLLCSDNVSVRRTDYPVTLRESLQVGLASLGITLSEGLLRAFERFYSGNQALSFSLTPQPGFDWEVLSQLPPEKVSEQLPLTFSVGGQGVVDTYYELEFGKLGSALQPSEDAGSQSELASEAISTTAPGAVKSYQAVPVEELDALIGLPVKVDHRGGKTTSGVLHDVRKGMLDISVPMASGDVIFHVRRRDVEHIEVYR